jgi:hypothetical protein
MPADERTEEQDERIRRRHGDEYEEREADRPEDEGDASDDEKDG